jgi:Tfp pilus assembly protein PilV
MTLIEVLVALVMLAVALVGMAGGLLTIARFQRNAGLRAEMTAAADALFERMRSGAALGTAADAVLLTVGGSTTSDNPVAPHVLDVTGASGRSLRLQWQVTNDATTLTRAVALRIRPNPTRSGDPDPMDFNQLLPLPP